MKTVFLDRSTIDASISLDAIRQLVTDYTEYELTSSEDIVPRAKDAEIIITNKVEFTDSVLSNLPELKLICITATGMNNVDLDAAKERNIQVKNVSGYSTHSVTQHVFSYLLSVLSNVPNYINNNVSKPWQNSRKFCQIDFPVNELFGKKFGILGYGNLGQSVAKVAEAFGMQVLISERAGVEKVRPGRVSFENMLASADIISLHCPLVESTNQLFNQTVFEQVKTGAILINTARGPIVDSSALVDALKSGKLSHAIIDVLEQEPPAHNHPLVQKEVPNLTLTHHIAWGSLQAQKTLMNAVAENIRTYLK